MVTSGPTIENAPIRTPAPSVAFASTTAVGCTPSGLVIDRLRRRRLRRRDPEAALQPLETALRGAKAAGHVGQVLLRGEDPLGLSHGYGRRAQAPLPGRHVRGHSRLGAQHRPVTDGQMVREADLAGGDDAAAEAARARDSDLGHDDRVLADLDVVADLNEIVDLGPAADDRLAEHGAIDRRVRADVHVVLDHDDAHLRDLAVSTPVEDVAEAVAADDGAGLDDDAAPQPDALAQNHPRVEHRSLAHLDVRSDVDERMD